MGLFNRKATTPVVTPVAQPKLTAAQTAKITNFCASLEADHMLEQALVGSYEEGLELLLTETAKESKALLNDYNTLLSTPLQGSIPMGDQAMKPKTVYDAMVIIKKRDNCTSKQASEIAMVEFPELFIRDSERKE